MKFSEKLFELRKSHGLSQEELGRELQVSRQTISKWESSQSYPDFQRLAMLSDYFGVSLDELVKDMDVQDVREKNLTDEKVDSIFSDIQNIKNILAQWCKMICYAVLAFIAIFCICFVVHLFFPDIEWFFQTY